MAVTNENSDLLVNIVASPAILNPNNKSKGKLCVERFNFTQGAAAGDANSTIRVCKLPARARYLSMFSQVRCSAFGAARVLSFGWEAYVNPFTLATIAASMTGLGTALDVATAAVKDLETLTGVVDEKEFENEVVIVAQCTGGTIPAAATLSGHIGYLLP